MIRLQDIQLRDPFVLSHEGVYYLFGSTDPGVANGPGFDVYRGVGLGELTTFTGPYPAFRPLADFWSLSDFWAPEVYPWGGGFAMFATFLPTDGHRGTAVLRAETPLGPFFPWSDGPVTPRDWDCRDGTLFVDEDRTCWMVFCHEWSQVGVGRVCAVRLSGDLRTSVGEPELLFTASEAPWAEPLPDHPGSYLAASPFPYRDTSGRLHLLWTSSGPYDLCRVGVATSLDGLAGPWLQSSAPLLDDNAGHGMVFAAPRGRRFLAVHSPNLRRRERPVFVELAETPDGLATTGEVVK